jgi:hypothetical protein
VDPGDLVEADGLFGRGQSVPGQECSMEEGGVSSAVEDDPRRSTREVYQYRTSEGAPSWASIAF